MVSHMDLSSAHSDNQMSRSTIDPSLLTEPQKVASDSLATKSKAVLSEADFAEPDSFISKLKTFTKVKDKLIAIRYLTKCPTNLHQLLLNKGLLDLVEGWLQSAAENNSIEQQGSILEYMTVAPIDVDMLRRSKLGRMIKKLTKHSDQKIKRLSGNLYEEWMKLVKKEKSAEPVVTAPQPVSVAVKEPVKPKVIPRIIEKPKATTIAPKPAAKSLDLHSLFSSVAAPPAPKKQKLGNKAVLLKAQQEIAKEEEENKKRKAAEAESSSKKSSTMSMNITDADSDKNVGADSKKKKKVTWAPEGLLRQIKIFESDERERKHTHNYKSMRDIDRDEASTAREALRRDMEASIEWKGLIKFKLPAENLSDPFQSVEGQIQKVRESKIPPLFLADPNRVPDSAAEPRLEDALSSDEKAKLIPLYEIKTSSVSTNSLNNNVQQILSTLATSINSKNAFSNIQPLQANTSFFPNTLNFQQNQGFNAFSPCAVCNQIGHLSTQCPYATRRTS